MVPMLRRAIAIIIAHLDLIRSLFNRRFLTISPGEIYCSASFFFFFFVSVWVKSIHLNRNPLDWEFHMMVIDFLTQRFRNCFKLYGLKVTPNVSSIDSRQRIFFVREISLM